MGICTGKGEIQMGPWKCRLGVVGLNFIFKLEWNFQ